MVLLKFLGICGFCLCSVWVRSHCISVRLTSGHRLGNYKSLVFFFCCFFLGIAWYICQCAHCFVLWRNFCWASAVCWYEVFLNMLCLVFTIYVLFGWVFKKSCSKSFGRWPELQTVMLFSFYRNETITLKSFHPIHIHFVLDLSTDLNFKFSWVSWSLLFS